MSIDENQPVQVIGRVTVDIPEARALVIGPDDRLLIVLPGHVDRQMANAHADRIREAIGNRFVIICGNDVQLAKVKEDEWGRHAIGD